VAAETGDRDKGAVSAQLVIATPLLLFLLLVTVQFAVWLHAVHIAQATAAQAVSAARAEDGSAAVGRSQADTILAQLGTGLLIDPQVSVTRACGQVHAQITGTVQAIVPGLHLPVEAIAAGPADAWTTP
jgi:Flp pilus assembly protein TadG